MNEQILLAANTVYCHAEASSSAGSASKYAFSFSNARLLCEILFFASVSISAYVNSVPSTANTGFQPKYAGPRAGTIVPSVRPWNRRISGGAVGLEGEGPGE